MSGRKFILSDVTSFQPDNLLSLRKYIQAGTIFFFFFFYHESSIGARQVYIFTTVVLQTLYPSLQKSTDKVSFSFFCFIVIHCSSSLSQIKFHYFLNPIKLGEKCFNSKCFNETVSERAAVFSSFLIRLQILLK